MIRHRFYVGTTRDGRHVRHDDVQECLVNAFAGWTMFRAFGAWHDARDNEVREDSIVYECLTENGNIDGRKVAAQCRDLAQQACVLWTFETVKGEFV